MSDISKVIDIALAEVGYLEKKTNSQLDSKTANAGYGNYTKYARDLDNVSGFYNGKKNGYAWCDIFVDWCFVQAFGTEKALELLCQPKKSTGAGCEFSMNFYRQKGQLYSSPKSGDQIFFKENGEISHTGLVYKVENGKVYTVEGNTSSTAGVVANGGCVAKKSYNLNSGYIAGYGRPKYDESLLDSGKDNTVIESEETKRIKDLQTALNKDFNCGLAVDGIIGPLTTNAVMSHYLKYFTKGNFVKWTQTQLKRKGYDLGSYEIDSCYGRDTEKAIKKLQKDNNAIIDGCTGIETVKVLVK